MCSYEIQALGLAVATIGVGVIAFWIAPHLRRQHELSRLFRLSDALETVGVPYNPPEVDEKATALVLREWRRLRFWIPEEYEQGARRVLTQSEAAEIEMHLSAMRTQRLAVVAREMERFDPFPAVAGLALILLGFVAQTVTAVTCG